MFPRRGPGLVRGMARTAVVAGTASAVSGRVAHRQQQRWASQEAEAAAEQQQVQPQQYAPEEPDYTAELEKLADLQQRGLITEEEFTAKKKQILGL